MITYGYANIAVESELDLAMQLGARVLEILPNWRAFPDPAPLLSRVADRGMSIHSAHGCWGTHSIKAARVDLGQPDEALFRQSVDDLKWCVDWLLTAGGTHLVVHPGGLSAPEEESDRRARLAQGLLELADHARGSSIRLCVENMPPGVHPGSRMSDLYELLRELGRPELALALDTGHAHISADLCTETEAAGTLLATTHVHDNNGQKDSHDPPGLGTIDWNAWAITLDSTLYRGPILLECIRQLREDPTRFRREVLAPLEAVDFCAGMQRGSDCSG